jgi:hypothetical protein
MVVFRELCCRFQLSFLIVQYILKQMDLETRALLGHYAALSSSCMPTFRHNLSGPIFKGQEVQEEKIKMGQIGCPETSVQNYTQRCLIYQKTADAICIAAEAQMNFYEKWTALSFRTLSCISVKSII